jgi:type IV pilus assembly protein PilA
LCLGYLLVLVTQRRQALHDLIAGTLVANDAASSRPAWLVSAAACVPVVFVAAGMAIPTYQDYTIRAQINEGLDLASGYRAAIDTAWRNSQRDFAELGSDSLGLGLPQRGRYVESIEVVSGMIVITYGVDADDAVAGRVLAIVPALDSKRSLAWACGYGQPPAGFAVVFENPASYSDIEERFVPSACRSPQ